jgi:DNA-binding transcriptional ArsR family regulator
MPLELNAHNANQVAARFRALSDPTRLRIVNHLWSNGEASVGEIAEAVGGSQQNISKHLSWLHDEAFVSRRKQGTSTRYRISDPAVLDLCDRICAAISDRLEPAPTPAG